MTSRSFLFSLCLLGLGSLTAPAQEPPESRPGETDDTPADATPAPASRPAPRVLTDHEAKKVTEQFKAEMKRKPPPPMLAKVRAVTDLGGVSHELVIKTLETVIREDPINYVKVAAARALADQPQAGARRALAAALADPKCQAQTDLMVALVQSLERTGYEPAQVDRLAALFEEQKPLVQHAIVKLFARYKEKAAIKLFLDHWDEPAPTNITEKKNPPAEWWKDRWEGWRLYLDDLKEAVKTITGQTFESADAARAWLKDNGAGIGITRW